MARRANWTRLRFPITAAALLLAAGLGWRHYEHSFYMDRTPLGDTLAGIRHIDSFVAGFGPGGNEVIVITYRLTAQAESLLRADPSAFIAQLEAAETAFSGESMQPRRRRSRECRIYRNWTPMPVTMMLRDPGAPDSGDASVRPVTFSEHIDRYGFGTGGGFKMPKDRLRKMEAVYASPLAIHARGRCGLFIYAPDLGEAYFVHVG